MEMEDEAWQELSLGGQCGPKVRGCLKKKPSTAYPKLEISVGPQGVTEV